MIAYRVACEDGQSRHLGLFPSRDDARTFAATGHQCGTTHHIVEVRWTPGRTICAAVVRAADDRTGRWEQRCTLDDGHDGPHQAGTWTDAA